MNALKVFQLIEQLGFGLIAEGNDIRIKRGEVLPAALRDNVIEYKPQILAMLKRDKKAKVNGLMIGIPGKLYTVTLSKISSIYIEQIEGGWEAWRETHYPCQRKLISSKIIANGNTFDFVLLRVKQYLDYINRKRKPT
ncbi:hypothetical protein [Priestia endophytica]|uniref:hypothetical protein n=1 Tax=Priestia endophytica TaxID=135735 RepID=UPI0022822C15|nr:hypothetical protein [Priestia endophytica]MCY8233894.1 hypothetical protein [Priestia endophytica]